MSEQRTFNTAIQGQALIAATNGLDIRALDFTNALQQLPPITGDIYRMYVNDLVQSSVGHFLVSIPTLPFGRNGGIFLGNDTAEQASNYISLFNLKDTSDVRILDFVKTNDASVTIELANNSFPFTTNHVTVDNLAFDPLFGYTAKAGTHRLVSVQKVGEDKVNFTILPGCCSDLENPYPPN